jgi:integrase
MAGRRRRRQYGFGSIQKRGRRFRVQWMVRGRRRSKSFAALETAESFLRKKVAAVELEDAGLPPRLEHSDPLSKLVPAWLEKRQQSHRSWRADASRWRTHLAPQLGHLHPDQVDAGVIRSLVQDRLAAGGLNPATVRLLVRLVSTLFSDLVDDGQASRNPVPTLTKKTRRLFRPTYDPKTTPFVEREADIGRIFFALPEPVNIAYALGALAGLRTGEQLALRWPHVDLERRRIHVRESIDGPLKDKDSRIAPILDALLPILVTWRARAQRLSGRVVPPLRARASHLDPHTLGETFADAQAALKPALPQELTWYQATRHTFASHWVMAGGGIETLQEILGHSSITTTQRYAHLRPDAFVQHHGRLGVLAGSTSSAPAPMRGLRGKVLQIEEIKQE